MAFPSAQNKELSVLQYSPLICAHKCDVGGKLGGHSIVTDIGAERVNLQHVPEVTLYTDGALESKNCCQFESTYIQARWAGRFLSLPFS